MKKIVVVTVNFNSDEETHNLLASLQKIDASHIAVDIVVVDNASAKPFQPTSEERKQGIFLLRTETNLGFSGGYNLGIKKALALAADVVVVLNNDTIVDPHCFTVFLETIEKNPHVGIVVPKIYFAKGHEFHKDRYSKKEQGKVFWYAGGFMDWRNVFSRHRGVDEVDKGQYDQIEKIDFATGCCMAIPSDVLKKVGGFDDIFFLYFEDADLSKRVLQAGYDIVYQPKAVIWHVNAASGGGSGSILHDYYITRNRMLFGMRYAPLRAKIALLRESIRLLFTGRQWQKIAVRDFYLRRFGKGSFGI